MGILLSISPSSADLKSKSMAHVCHHKQTILHRWLIGVCLEPLPSALLPLGLLHRLHDGFLSRRIYVFK